jgi:hypothetical protein
MDKLKAHFIKLMEEVDPNYQPPVPNSGNGITKFAPTPANQVITPPKSYNVDGDFLRKAISFGGLNGQAIDQLMGALDGHPEDGVLSGSHFDTLVGGFGVQPQAAMPVTPAPTDVGATTPEVTEPVTDPACADGSCEPQIDVAPIDDVDTTATPDMTAPEVTEPEVTDAGSSVTSDLEGTEDDDAGIEGEEGEEEEDDLLSPKPEV